ncbi:MAG: hypothetical protein ACRC92_22465, partial [Peptostreptococcaceae bacterium]
QKIDIAKNDYVSIQYVIYNIKNNILEMKEELLSLQQDMIKLNGDKAKTIKIDEIITAIEGIDYRDERKLNANIAQLDILNEEIDKMIDIYNNDENMKNDIIMSNAIMDIEALDSLIDDIMERHNDEYTESFNNVIKKFPANVVAKVKDWTEIDKFSSIN